MNAYLLTFLPSFTIIVFSDFSMLCSISVLLEYNLYIISPCTFSFSCQNVTIIAGILRNLQMPLITSETIGSNPVNSSCEESMRLLV